MRNSTRPGFHFGELLVVLAILSIAALIIIPAVQKVRDAAARTRTNSELRQCAMAVHLYHGTNNRLPDAASTGGIYKDLGEERSIWFHLLPFLEAQDVYKNNVHDAAEITYISPSDPYVGMSEGKINFAANIRLFGYETLGKDIADNAVGGGAGDPSGQTLAGHLRATMTCGLALRDIKDGTSNTLMITTRYADCGSPVQSTCYSASPIGTMLAGGGPVASVGVPKSGKGAFFGAGAHDAPADPRLIQATFQLAPRLAECRPDDSVFGHSFGTGGLSVAVGDASIRSLDPNMSTTLFCRMLCPSDGFPL